jgi:hypothetical protein
MAIFERTYSNCEEVLLWVKCYLIALNATEKYIKEATDEADFTVVLF